MALNVTSRILYFLFTRSENFIVYQLYLIMELVFVSPILCGKLFFKLISGYFGVASFCHILHVAQKAGTSADFVMKYFLILFGAVKDWFFL